MLARLAVVGLTIHQQMLLTRSCSTADANETNLLARDRSSRFFPVWPLLRPALRAVGAVVTRFLPCVGTYLLDAYWRPRASHMCCWVS